MKNTDEIYTLWPTSKPSTAEARKKYDTFVIIPLMPSLPTNDHGTVDLARQLPHNHQDILRLAEETQHHIRREESFGNICPDIIFTGLTPPRYEHQDYHGQEISSISEKIYSSHLLSSYANRMSSSDQNSKLNFVISSHGGPNHIGDSDFGMIGDSVIKLSLEPEAFAENMDIMLQHTNAKASGKILSFDFLTCNSALLDISATEPQQLNSQMINDSFIGKFYKAMKERGYDRIEVKGYVGYVTSLSREDGRFISLHIRPGRNQEGRLFNLKAMQARITNASESEEVKANQLNILTNTILEYASENNLVEEFKRALKIPSSETLDSSSIHNIIEQRKPDSKKDKRINRSIDTWITYLDRSLGTHGRFREYYNIKLLSEETAYVSTPPISAFREIDFDFRSYNARETFLTSRVSGGQNSDHDSRLAANLVKHELDQNNEIMKQTLLQAFSIHDQTHEFTHEFIKNHLESSKTPIINILRTITAIAKRKGIADISLVEAFEATKALSAESREEVSSVVASMREMSLTNHDINAALGTSIKTSQHAQRTKR